MSAQIVYSPRSVGMLPPTTEKGKRHEIPKVRKIECSQISSEIRSLILLSLCTPPPTPEDLRREYFLLECD